MTTFDRGYALIVGVGGDLPDTIQDARGLADMLKDPSRCAYPPAQVYLLTGEAATRDAVLAALDGIVREAGDRSTVIVYFSGHGYRVDSPTGEFYYLMPYGYDVDRLYRTAIEGKEFTDKLRSIRAQKLLLLLDCCHAGGVGDSKAPAALELAKAPLPPQAQDLLAEGSGRVVIASSREDELSYAGRPYSAFTLAVVEALCGEGVAKHDGLVRVADLALHARQVVPGRTKERQHPILHFEHADNFAVAYYAGGEAAPKGVPFAAQVEIEPEPGAWAALDQRGQTVVGPQTNIVGDVAGPVLSGQFSGPTAVGGGDALDLRGSQGAVVKPTGPVSQHFGDSISVTGDGNVIGDRSSHVVKTQTGDVRDSTIYNAGGNIIFAGQPGASIDIEPSPESMRLQRLLRSRLDLEDFRTLCFDLGIRYDDLRGEGLAGKARELVLHLQQREALHLLVEWLRVERPDIRV
ncbi:MAG: caspase family protein [Anaerolineae bacterium]|nr:caspase family protein [Anaerolineae bacterium]